MKQLALLLLLATMCLAEPPSPGSNLDRWYQELKQNLEKPPTTQTIVRPFPVFQVLYTNEVQLSNGTAAIKTIWRTTNWVLDIWTTNSFVIHGLGGPATNIVIVPTNLPVIIPTNPVVIVTNPPVIPPPNEATTNEEGLRVEFELLQDIAAPTGNPQGVLFVAPGIEVSAVWQDGPYGTLYFKFHPTLDGVRLYKRERGVSIGISMPAPDNQWHKFVATCDLRRIAATRDGVFALVKNDYNSMTNVLYIGNSHNGWPSDPAYREASRPDGSDKWNHYVKYRNISVTRFPVSHPGARYRHVTWIGNSSVPQFGQGVHSGFHPYKKFVCIGTNIFAHNGYDEGRHQVKRFSIQNPQFVNARFGNGGRTMGTTSPGIVPVDLAASGGILYVKTADGLVDSYDPNTLTPVKLRDTAFPSTTETWNGLIARVDYENDQVVVGDKVIGQKGGYKANGTAVTLDKFGHYYFDGAVPAQSGFAAFQSDGKLWISDAVASRYIRYHFVSSLNQWESDGTVIQFVPHTSYVCSVDQNDLERVFSRYLEFRYSYSQNAWTLVRNWEPKQGDGMHGFMDGFHTVRTVNGKTMALVNWNNGPRKQLVELGPNGITPTVYRDLHPDWRLEIDGSVTYWKQEPGSASFWSSDFKTERYLGSIALTNGSPVWMVKRVAGTDQVITYAPQANHPGPHLGSVRSGSWTWFGHRAPRGPFNGLGNFDSYCGHWTEEEQIINGQRVKVKVWKYTYAGDWVPPVIIGRSVFIHEFGEFYRESGQANQTMEWDIDGNFIAQFGTMAFDYTDLAAPLSASNSKSIDGALINGEPWVFLANEQSVGVQVATRK